MPPLGRLSVDGTATVCRFSFPFLLSFSVRGKKKMWTPHWCSTRIITFVSLVILSVLSLTVIFRTDTSTPVDTQPQDSLFSHPKRYTPHQRRTFHHARLSPRAPQAIPSVSNDPGTRDPPPSTPATPSTPQQAQVPTPSPSQPAPSPSAPAKSQDPSPSLAPTSQSPLPSPSASSPSPSSPSAKAQGSSTAPAVSSTSNPSVVPSASSIPLVIVASSSQGATGYVCCHLQCRRVVADNLSVRLLGL